MQVDRFNTSFILSHIASFIHGAHRLLKVIASIKNLLSKCTLGNYDSV